MVSTTTRKGQINYKSGFYSGDKPYRDILVAALKYFDATKFKVGEEFWTLGGKEWYEFKHLLDSGIEFGPKTYHNVDRRSIDRNPDRRVVAHRFTEFENIHRIWHNPKVLCFDCTSIIADSNEHLWTCLIRLAMVAAQKSGRVILNTNFMTGYGTLGRKLIDATLNRYMKWISMAISIVRCNRMHIDVMNRAVCAAKEKSYTEMLSGHFCIQG